MAWPLPLPPRVSATGWLLLLTLALPVLLPAQNTLTVNATQTIRTVDARMFGVNAVMWDGQTASAQTISMVQDAGLTTIRIPGGSASDAYDWSTGKSYATPGVLNSWAWSANFDKFSQLITGINGQAVVTVNYGSGTPQQAAAWVAYTNASASLLGTGADVAIGVDSLGVDWRTAGYWSALRAAAPLGTDDGRNFLRMQRSSPFNLRYWEIGNECYGSWETDNHAAQWDPVTYATVAKDYIAKMNAIDPTIKIGVVASLGEDNLDSRSPVHNVTNPRTGVAHHGWTPVMLATLKTLAVTPDFMIYHRYDQAPSRESDATLLQASSTWAADATSLRQNLTDYLGNPAAAGVEMVVTENNSVYGDPGKQITSLVNGLFYADSLANVLQTEFNSFLWWDLRNGPDNTKNNSALLYGWRLYGDYGILSSPGPSGTTWGPSSYYDAYPTYYMMKLMSRFVRGGDTVVRATSSNLLLSACAARRLDGSLSLLVINKSPTIDATASIALTGFAPRATATVYSYGIPQDEAARTGTGSRDLATTTISNAAASFPMSFPRYSATVISLAEPAPEILVQPTAIATGTGANVVFSVLATGSGTITYQWQKDGLAIAGATSASLALNNVSGANAGSYGVVVRDGSNVAVTSNLVPLTVSAQAFIPPGSTMINISTRAQVGTGGNIMIAGFVISGSGSKKVLIRAVGPGLAQYLPGTLADPKLELTTLSGTVLATNDDWGTVDAAAIAAGPGAALAVGSKDAAMIVTLPVGQYTALVKGVSDTTGLALVELYDLDQRSAARLINLSTRAQVGTGGTAMIAGFVVVGASPRNVLVRALGPTLSQWLPSTLPDPQLNLTSLSGTSLATNDNWDATNGAAIVAAATATGAYPLAAGTRDSALLIALPEGQYTPQITDHNGASGLALVEVYEAP